MRIVLSKPQAMRSKKSVSLGAERLFDQVTAVQDGLSPKLLSHKGHEFPRLVESH
jgi:hypothetical protein